MIRTPPPPSSASTTSTEATVCGHCRSDDRWVLHNVKHRGLYRNLCTSCVLKLHPTSFCPSCFSLHDIPLSSSTSSSINTNYKTLTCFKCSSLSHITCVPSNAPKSPYLCPPCSNPSYKFFDFRKPKKDRGVQDLSKGGKDSDSNKVIEDKQVLDLKAAKVLLTATRIALISMNKAVAVVKVDAERRVKESAVARRRAKEAIDLVMALTARISMMGIGNKRPTSVPATPGLVASKGPSVGPGVMKVEKNGHIHTTEIKNVVHPSTERPVMAAGVVARQNSAQNGSNSISVDKSGGNGGGKVGSGS